jgi:hypothetical protein
MTVTETTVHKLNGVPYYVWKQNEDKVWVRVPVDAAAKELLGVITGHDAFEFRYQATLPTIDGPARCWLPLAASDEFQKVTVKAIHTPVAHRTLIDKAHGNTVLFLELGPEHSGQSMPRSGRQPILLRKPWCRSMMRFVQKPPRPSEAAKET